jgi:2-C-methyl-D-erythritol 4-phosphate cytidylyltransferase
VICAIVVAGGSGERFGREGGKQLAPVAGAPLVSHALRAIADASLVDAVVLVCDGSRIAEFRAVAQTACGDKLLAVVAGGATRGISVRAGIVALPADCDVVAVHDGARPLVRADVVNAAVAHLIESVADGVVVGHPAVDTVKSVRGDLIEATPARASQWLAHTPQVFRLSALRDAHSRAVAEGYEGTDDSVLVERAGGRVLVYRGPRWNVKVTAPEDVLVVEALLKGRGEDDQL